MPKRWSPKFSASVVRTTHSQQLDTVAQGIQHLASRVDNLTLFIERVNNYRQITGGGFSFLRIPRSYYGR